MAKDMAVDFSALDPDSVASSSTPKMPNKAANGVRSHQSTIRPNEEEDESVYSLHLSALGPISPISPLQDDHELRAELEEPGGPSDFTQNMFDWINGPAKHNKAAAYQSPQSVIHSHAQQAQIDEEEESVHEQDAERSTSQKEKHLLDMTAEEVEEKFAKLQDRCDELQTMWDTLNARFQKQKLEYAEEARLQKEKRERAEEARLQKEKLEATENAGRMRTPKSRRSSLHYEVKNAQNWRHKSSVYDADQDKSQNRATTQSQQDEIDQLKQQLKNEQALRRKERDAASIREAELVRSYEAMMQQLAESHTKRMSPKQQQNAATPVLDSVERRTSQEAVNAGQQDAQDARTAGIASRFVDKAVSPRIISHGAKVQVKDRAVSPGQTAADANTRHTNGITQLEAVVVRLQDKLDAERADHAAAILAIKAEYDAVEKDVDAWMLDQVEQRKRVTDASAVKKDKKISSLKTKVEELEQLNARYEKELMLSWGREEFGRAPPGEKQKYRYKYT